MGRRFYPGVDPYTRVVSDAYQDLFAEGSFVGKGIYDVDAFRSALEGRLPGVTKFFAKTFFGAGFLDRASWDSSVVHLERAVELKPDYLFHRLELAQTYLDVDRVADARRQLEEVLRLPPASDVSDPQYQDEARALLQRIEGSP